MTAEIDSILLAQAEASERGAVVIWTIYDRPKDHPDGFIARQFEIRAGVVVATSNTLTGKLDSIRDTFASAGLVCLPRHPSDEPHVVECWI